MIQAHPFVGRRAAIATMHRKERVIGPIWERWFGMALETAGDVDTDALGTFTGETPRLGDMLDAARAKARLAIDRTGAPIGLGSEGAFGPHPVIPFLASGLEVVLLVDAEMDIEIVAQRRTATNYDSTLARPGEDIAPFLDRIGFPDHAVVVRPEGRSDATDLVKGVADASDLRRAIDRASAHSVSGAALVQTDMRAHLNPKRMKSIGYVARRLALRAARLCPDCRTPGYGLADVLRGLPCEACDAPTRRIRAEIHRCLKCGFQRIRREKPHSMRAPAIWCDVCNP